MNKKKYSYISIGQKINELTCNNLINDNNDLYRKLGKDYVHYCKKCHKNLNSNLISNILISKLSCKNLMLFNFLQKYKNSTFVSQSIFVNNKYAQCSLKLFHNVNINYLNDSKEDYEIYIKEITNKYNTFVVLDNFVSLKKGFGKKLIKKIQKQINCPIILQAGYLKYGDYAYAQQNKDFSCIKSLAKYYKKLGFKNINDNIGDYNESIVMIYNH